MNTYRDTDDEEQWDDEGSDDHDAEGSDDELTVPCPYCRREIVEDSPRCPYCEQYISEEDRPTRKQPLWVIVTAVICLGFAIWWAISA